MCQTKGALPAQFLEFLPQKLFCLTFALMILAQESRRTQRKLADEAKRDVIINLEEAKISHRRMIMTLRTGVTEKGVDSAVRTVQPCSWGQGTTAAAVPAWEAVRGECLGQEKSHRQITGLWQDPGVTWHETSQTQRAGVGKMGDWAVWTQSQHRGGKEMWWTLLV